MRELMYVDSKDRIVVERQHKTKNPPGNASQRKKAIRSGWKPDWVTDEKRFVESLGPTSTPENVQIGNDNEQIALLARAQADQTVADIEEQIENFELPPFVPTPVFIGHQLLCWVCDQKYSSTTHEGHPICDDCLDHFLHPSIGQAAEDAKGGLDFSGQDGMIPIIDRHEYHAGSHNPDICPACINERADFHQKVADAQKHS